MKLSDTIKLELMKYLRFERNFTFVCTEGIHNSDISAVTEKCLVEVEVKISKSDFRREFQSSTIKAPNRVKLTKHHFYKCPEDAWRGYILPNKFYFCVPEEMASWALEYMKDKNKKYGLLAYCPERIGCQTDSKIKTIRGAKNIHCNEPENRVFRAIGIRTTNELITLKTKYNKDKAELEALQEGVLKVEGITKEDLKKMTA